MTDFELGPRYHEALWEIRETAAIHSANDARRRARKAVICAYVSSFCALVAVVNAILVSCGVYR